MNHEFKVGDQFDLVESLGNAYYYDQSIAPKGYQFVGKRTASLIISLIKMGESGHSGTCFWADEPFNEQVPDVKSIGRFTITSLKNQHN